MRILIMLIFLLAGTVSALDTSGLTNEQKAEIALHVAKQKAQNENMTPKEIQEYADLGESIAKALGACANEMGVAVNDFADSKVGMIATILIVWKVAGESIMGYVVGMSLFMVGTCIWLYLFRKMCVVESVTYHDNGKINEISYYREGRVDGTRTMMMIVIFILMIVCCIIMF